PTGAAEAGQAIAGLLRDSPHGHGLAVHDHVTISDAPVSSSSALRTSASDAPGAIAQPACAASPASAATAPTPGARDPAGTRDRRLQGRRRGGMDFCPIKISARRSRRAHGHRRRIAGAQALVRALDRTVYGCAAAARSLAESRALSGANSKSVAPSARTAAVYSGHVGSHAG